MEESLSPTPSSEPHIKLSLKTKITNLFLKIKSFRLNNKRAFSLGISVFLIAAIPLTVFTIINGRTNFFNRAATAEPPITGEPPVQDSPRPTPNGQYYLRVIQPNGGEKLTVGQNYTVTWDSSKNFDSVKYQYVTKNGFASAQSIAFPDTGSFTWSVNTLFPTETSYKIYLYGFKDGNMVTNDVSDNYFEIAKATPTPISTPTTCVRKNHTVELLPSSKTGFPGQYLSYNAWIKNNDSTGCPASTFYTAARLPNQAWTSNISQVSVTLQGGQTGTPQVSFSSSPKTTAGSYPVGVDVTGPRSIASATATYVVSQSDPPSTIRPTAKPTPTPPPAKVVITTNTLPVGRVNYPYTATVTGYDNYPGANLKMTITNLPAKLVQGDCSMALPSESRRYIYCYISGTPTRWGIFLVRVTLSDNFGKVTTKTLPLLISPSFSRPPPVSPYR